MQMPAEVMMTVLVTEATVVMSSFLPFDEAERVKVGGLALVVP